MNDVFDQSPLNAFTESPLNARNSGRCTGSTVYQCAHCLADDTPKLWHASVTANITLDTTCLGATGSKKFLSQEQPAAASIGNHPVDLDNCRWSSNKQESAGTIVRTYVGAGCTSTDADTVADFYWHVLRQSGSTLVWISEESANIKGGQTTPPRVIFYGAATAAACGRRGTISVANQLLAVDAGEDVSIDGVTYRKAGSGGHVSVQPSDCSECIQGGAFGGCGTSDCCSNATKFRLCVTGETGDCEVLNVGAVTLTKQGDGTYQLIAPQLYRFDLTVAAAGGVSTTGIETWTVDAYRWSASGWTLCRTITGLISRSTTCAATLTDGGVAYMLWAAARWSHYRAIIRPQGIQTVLNQCCGKNVIPGPPAYNTSAKVINNDWQGCTIGSRVDPLECTKTGDDEGDGYWLDYGTGTEAGRGTCTYTLNGFPTTKNTWVVDWRNPGWLVTLGATTGPVSSLFYAIAAVAAGCNGSGTWVLANVHTSWCAGASLGYGGTVTLTIE